MADINPEKLSWSAPTKNTDGSDITEPLSYTLGVSDDGGEFVETLSFPGSLNPDGSYSVAFSELALEPGAHSIALRAFYVDQPEAKSGWSGALDIVLHAVPEAPFGLAAE